MSLLLIATLAALALVLVGVWAQVRTAQITAALARVRPVGGLTGVQAAVAVARVGGESVTVRAGDGRWSDRYDPREQTLVLFPETAATSSLPMVAVAAHEAGHAVQDAVGDERVRIVAACRPIAEMIQSYWFWPVAFGWGFGVAGVVVIALALFGLAVAFEFATLAYERDASTRAMKALFSQGLLTEELLAPAEYAFEAASLHGLASIAGVLRAPLRYRFKRAEERARAEAHAQASVAPPTAAPAVAPITVVPGPVAPPLDRPDFS